MSHRPARNTSLTVNCYIYKKISHTRSVLDVASYKMSIMLKERYDTLIFDLDNTLVDRNGAMRQTIGLWLQEQGNDKYNDTVILDAVMEKDNWGYQDRFAFADWLHGEYGIKSDMPYDKEELLNWLFQRIPGFMQPTPAVSDFLRLAGQSFRLGLATNGSSVNQRNKLRLAEITDLFEPGIVFISGEVGVPKPDPIFYQRMIEKAQVDPARTLFIGDHPEHDIAGPKGAGFDACWVSYDRSFTGKIEPDLVVAKTTDLAKWF